MSELMIFIAVLSLMAIYGFLYYFLFKLALKTGFKIGKGNEE